MRIVVPCPAKVNTFLSVGPREPSGYHAIRTVMQAVSLCDTLTVTAGAAETAIRSTWTDLPPENTLTKTLRLVGEMVNIPTVDIYLDKRIPVESGLGGGSSDAAGLLRALQRILLAPLPEPSLMDVAAAVGMDVPFFLIGGRASAEGYGERLTPLSDVEKQWLVIAKPSVGCPTSAAYTALDAKSYDWEPLPEKDSKVLYNDFERVAPCECLDLIELLQVYGATTAGLSGSGSAVFGFFPSREAAQAAKDLLDAGSHGSTWVAHTLTRSESLSITSS